MLHFLCKQKVNRHSALLYLKLALRLAEIFFAYLLAKNMFVRYMDFFYLFIYFMTFLWQICI